MSSRNLANQITQESVDALVAACVRGFPIVGRYYRLKRRLLGLDELFDYDRYAPLEFRSAVLRLGHRQGRGAGELPRLL